MVVVLKKGHVFGIRWREHVVVIYGDNIMYTGSERTKTKFKERRVKAIM